MDIAVIMGILAAIAAAVLSQLMTLRGRKAAKAQRQLREDLSKRSLKVWDDYYEKLVAHLSTEDEGSQKPVEDFRRTLLALYGDSWRNSFVHSTVGEAYVTKAEFEAKISENVETISKRVQEIEARFPSQATIEKIASVNDAILATNYEALHEAIKKMEGSLLTKWDVAKIVFEIIAALAAIVAIVVAVLKYA